MIEVKHLSKRYGDFIAVDDLSFHAEKGRIYGFLGPNGAGKSTTMNMITGYLSATSGTVNIHGHDIVREPEEAKRHIGYLPEIPPVYTDMTPVEYLSFAGGLKGIRGRSLKQEIDRVMALTGVTHMGRRLIRNLSKGYRQRVGFACALLGDPEIIILDEPFVGLDPKQILDMRDLIRSLGQEHTVIFSSHILSEVSAVCDYIWILAHGKLVASDTTQNLEQQMQGANVYDLLIRGEMEPLRGLIGSIPGIRSLRISAQPSGDTSVHVETEESVDPREEIFRRLARADCPILELTSSHMSLEDVFLQLTGQGENRKGGEEAHVGHL